MALFALWGGTGSRRILMGSEGLQQRQRFANTERKGFYRDCQHSGDVRHAVFSCSVITAEHDSHCRVTKDFFAELGFR